MKQRPLVERGLETSPAPHRNRTYAVFLLVGALLTLGLLVRQLFDLAADAHQATLRDNDLFSALGSVVILALIAFVWLGTGRKVHR